MRKKTIREIAKQVRDQRIRGPGLNVLQTIQARQSDIGWLMVGRTTGRKCAKNCHLCPYSCPNMPDAICPFQKWPALRKSTAFFAKEATLLSSKVARSPPAPLGSEFFFNTNTDTCSYLREISFKQNTKFKFKEHSLFFQIIRECASRSCKSCELEWSSCPTWNPSFALSCALGTALVGFSGLNNWQRPFWGQQVLARKNVLHDRTTTSPKNTRSL